MNNKVRTPFGVSAIAFVVLTAGPYVAQAEDVAWAGVYSLTAVGGHPLPVTSWTVKPDGERCSQVILEGALLLDSEGRSAAFITEKVVCESRDASEVGGIEHSVIFVGSYTSSGNRITVEDDFGTDAAILEDDVLVYETGAEGDIRKFVFTKE